MALQETAAQNADEHDRPRGAQPRGTARTASRFGRAWERSGRSAFGTRAGAPGRERPCPAQRSRAAPEPGGHGLRGHLKFR